MADLRPESLRPAVEARFTLLAILALWAAIYLPRLTQIPLRGEETRWATAAQGMLETGDWIVSRQQGRIYADRPPFMAWMMLSGGLLFGHVSPLAIRLPSVLAVLITALLIWRYAQTHFGKLAAVVAAAVWLTIPQVMELGRTGECDAVFSCLVVAMLLVWHAGTLQPQEGAGRAILVGVLAGMATLTKGPQAPFFLGVCAVLYLLALRRYKDLFSWRLALSVGVLLTVVGCWFVPYVLRTDWKTGLWIWNNLTFNRMHNQVPGQFWRHLVAFPPELAGTLLPWLLLVPVWFVPAVRRARQGDVRTALFCGTVMLVGLLPIWLSSQGRPRYVMPAFPFLAMFAGLVVERVTALGQQSRLAAWWRRAIVGGCGFVGMAGLAWIAIATLHQPKRAIEPLPWLWGPVLCCAGGLAWWIARRAMLANPAARVGPLAFAGCLALVYQGPVLATISRICEDTAAGVARVKSRLPADANMWSVGRAHHIFTYYYARPLDIADVLYGPVTEYPAGEYFCFEASEYGQFAEQLPFRWRVVDQVSCEKYREREPKQFMVIAQRLPEASSMAERPAESLAKPASR